MRVALDVQYADPKAAAAAVLFSSWTSWEVADEVLVGIDGVLPYVAGSFYQRELPCLLAVLAEVQHRHGSPELILVDGYVNLSEGHPGLGRRLYDALGIPVVGVAKTRFHQAEAIEVLRGTSSAPLFVTAVGVDVEEAAQAVHGMSGPYRLPAMLQRADKLAREGAKNLG